jgi:hypothetical protein
MPCLIKGLIFPCSRQATEKARYVFGQTLRAALADPGTRAWLSQHLFFDLAAHPEFLGALARVRPDSMLRHVERRLSPCTDGDDELVNIRPRPGASLDGCGILAVEQRLLGLGRSGFRLQARSRASVGRKTDRTFISVIHAEHSP